MYLMYSFLQKNFRNDVYVISTDSKELVTTCTETVHSILISDETLNVLCTIKNFKIVEDCTVLQLERLLLCMTALLQTCSLFTEVIRLKPNEVPL